MTYFIDGVFRNVLYLLMQQLCHINTSRKKRERGNYSGETSASSRDPFSMHVFYTRQTFVDEFPRLRLLHENGSYRRDTICVVELDCHIFCKVRKCCKEAAEKFVCVQHRQETKLQRPGQEKK